MKILGLTLEQNAGFAILVDDKIIFAASQERYSRKKSDESYPIDAINDALKYCKIQPKELDKVVIGNRKIPIVYSLLRMYSNFSVADHLIAMEKYWRPTLVDQKQLSLLKIFENKISKDRFPFNSPFASKMDYTTIENGNAEENIEKRIMQNHLISLVQPLLETH